MASSNLTWSPLQHANFLNNSDPAKGISLVIPRVFNNIGWRRIKKHIIEANLGFVERIDVVPVAEGKYKRAFVHFAPGKWNMRDSTARDALKALQAGESIKLEYESPWYWLVGISGAARPDEAPKSFKNLVGTRAEVMHGTAYKTGYGKVKSDGGNSLTKTNLKYNKNGRIVSREHKTKVVIETGSSGESKQNNTEKLKRANAAVNRLKRANAAENRLKRANAAEKRLKRVNAAEKRLNKTTKKGGRRKKRKTRRKKKSKKKCRKKRKKSRKTKSNKR